MLFRSNKNITFQVNNNGTTANALTLYGANLSAVFPATVTSTGNLLAQSYSFFKNTLLPSGTVNIGAVGTAFANVYAGNFVGNVVSSVITPTQISAGGSTGTSGQVLASTGTGLNWLSLSATSISSGTNSVSVGVSSIVTAISSTTIETINSAGTQTLSLGVGTSPSGTTGEIRATNNITAYYSDERLKTRLGAIENALDKVDQLSGFYHEANELAQSMGYEAVREVGVSAQEVQKVMPEIVAPAPIDPEYLTVRYERLTPLLIEAIKELRQEVNELKNKIDNR